MLIPYTGKTPDNFGYVLNEMLAMSGCSTLDNADCMSLRCFAYDFSGDAAGWFRPLISNVDAVKRLSAHMRHGELKISDAMGFDLSGHKCIMLICRKSFFAGDDLSGEFYSGAGNYLLCSKDDDGGLFTLRDMTNHYCDFAEAEELKEWLSLCGEYAVSVEGEPEFSPPSFRETVSDAYSLRMSCRHLETAGTLSRREEIALRLGLMNYQIQLGKALSYISAEAEIDSSIYETWRGLLNLNTADEAVRDVNILEDKFTEMIGDML
ncbi:MAG: hypothetical protein IJS28_00510 [Synergistaceae bacterium]|nr:hypothetical protein [Synergistaceae bacterium]